MTASKRVVIIAPLFSSYPKHVYGRHNGDIWAILENHHHKLWNYLRRPHIPSQTEQAYLNGKCSQYSILILLTFMLVMRLWTFCSSKTGGMGRMITSIGMLWTSWMLSEWIERFSLLKLLMFRLKIPSGFTLAVPMCFRETPLRVWNINRKSFDKTAGKYFVCACAHDLSICSFSPSCSISSPK